MVPEPARWKRRRGIALAAGLAHFVLGVCLQLYARQGLPGAYLLLLASAAAALVLVVTGALPVLLWARYRLVTPGAAVVGWFLWGVHATWAMRAALPWGAFQGINWDGVPPSPDYMLKSTLLLLGVLALAGVELLARKAGRGLFGDGGPLAEP